MTSFDLPEEAKTTLEAYNLIGQTNNTLVNSKIVAGRQPMMWDGTDYRRIAVASGLYFYRIKAVGETNTFPQKMKIKILLVR